MTDPIADMLTRIRNANIVRHETVEIPASNTKRAIAMLMLREGFIKAVDMGQIKKELYQALKE